MNIVRTGFVFLLGSLAILAGATAHAQSRGDAIFQQGVADMQAGRYDTACPAIAESNRLEPTAGTVFTLAECYNNAGKYDDAVPRYEEYLSMFSRMSPDEQSKQLGRDKISREKLGKLKSMGAGGGDLSGQQLAGIVVGSLGVAGLIMGAITGGLSLATKSTIEENCDIDRQTCRNQEGIDAVDSIEVTGLVSTIGFIAGGALAATGIIVFFTSPSTEVASAPAAVTFAAGPGSVSIAISGRF